jgi:hypothetical protein
LDALADVLKELARREGYVVKVEKPEGQCRTSGRTATRVRKAKAA